MKRTILYLCLIVVCSGLYSSDSRAQTRQLTEFVTNPDNNASDLQMAIGIAVQTICPNIGGPTQTGARLDLFLRCNELIGTAAELNTGQNPGRSLGITGDELLGALQQVSGEELLGQTTLSTRVTNGQFSNIAGRLNALRLGGAGSALGGRVAATGSYKYPDTGSPGYGELSLETRSLTGSGAAGDAAGSKLGWFLEGSFNTGDRDQTSSEDGFDFDATSVTLGLDYRLNSGVIGVSAGIDNYEADFDTNMVVTGGDVEVEGTSGSLFGAWYRGNLYFDGIVSFGSLDSDTTRRAVYSSNNTCAGTAGACPGENATLIGETDGEYVAAGATIGYDANRGNWDITTTLSVAYRDIDIDSYNETDSAGGGLSLSYADQTIESLRSILGVAFTGNFSKSFGILSPHLRLEWHHEFEDDPARLIAKYAVEEQLATAGVTGAAGAGVFSLVSGQCLSCFQINSDEIDTDFALVGIGLTAVFTQRVQIYGVYDALLGIDNLSSSSFSVGIRSQF